jgi:hypothetical protein
VPENEIKNCKGFRKSPVSNWSLGFGVILLGKLLVMLIVKQQAQQRF